MRVILHIGQQKTGTTAIQETLRRDRPRLAEMGILFPDTGHDRGLRGRRHANHNGFYMALRRGTSDTQTLDEIRTELHDQIDAAAPHTLLISAEAAFMAADHSTTKVFDHLEELVGPDVEIVAYLRRPDRYLMSFHQQLIRNGLQIEGLHTAERLDRLATTCQLDYLRAIEAYRARFETVRVFRYDDIGDAVGHFYAEVLGVDAPEQRPDRANVGLPAVMVDLARRHTNDHGRLSWHQVRSIANFGPRESVDLLGPTNRVRVRDIFAAQNGALGALIGRDAFFDDLDAIVDVPDAAITPEEANERYETVFDALASLPTVHEVRRDCLALEAAGHHMAASRLLSVHLDRFSVEDVAWFDADLRAATDDSWRLVDGHYQPHPLPTPTALERATTLARRIAGRGRRSLRRAQQAAQRRLTGS